MQDSNRPFSGIIVGLDCAAQPERFGIAIATALPDTPPILHLARMGRRREDIAGRVCDCVESLQSSGGDLIVSMDAPLGWPSELGRALQSHRAGDPLPPGSNRLFRRQTDDAIHDALGLRPLEVGADRIARAAVTAVNLLGGLRTALDRSIPVATAPWRELAGPAGHRSCAIEVYPAAYLSVHGPLSRKYKDREARDRRAAILDQLRTRVSIDADAAESALDHADVLDAIVCVAAALDYVEGRSMEPPRGEDLSVEGWAWVPRP